MTSARRTVPPTPTRPSATACRLNGAVDGARELLDVGDHANLSAAGYAALADVFNGCALSPGSDTLPPP